jgi:N-acyl-L-homoserine lactone synthetase
MRASPRADRRKQPGTGVGEGWIRTIGSVVRPGWRLVPAWSGGNPIRVGRPVSTDESASAALMARDLAQLRYDVYCLELTFLDPARFPDGRETDEYDAASVHLSVTDDEGELAGALRLVLDSPLGFPLEAHARTLSPSFFGLPRGRTAEISRLVVARQHRNVRRFEGYPLTLLRLFREVHRKSRELGLSYWLAAMEPSLRRLLASFGAGFVEIGGPMDYFGEVLPYSAAVRDVEEAVARTRAEIFRYVTGPAGGLHEHRPRHGSWPCLPPARTT